MACEAVVNEIITLLISPDPPHHLKDVCKIEYFVEVCPLLFSAYTLSLYQMHVIIIFFSKSTYSAMHLSAL